MKKLLAIGLSLLLGAACLSGCGQASNASTGTTSATEGAAQVTEGTSQAVSETSADAGNTDEIFVWDGTVITGLTEKGKTAEDIVIPDTCTEIGQSAFENVKMKSVVIGAGVEAIGDSAFYQCTKLEAISFPASVQTIGKRAFYFASLKTITFSEGLVEIGEEAFACTDVETVTLPESLVTIGRAAFNPCPKVHGFYIPASMENISMETFGWGFNFGTKIYVKEGSWADLNFDEFIPKDPFDKETLYYEKAYY